MRGPLVHEREVGYACSREQRLQCVLLEIYSMFDVAGNTSDGVSFTGLYTHAASNSVVWAATYRKDGVYSGRRNGRVFGVGTFTAVETDQAVANDIEQAWFDLT